MIFIIGEINGVPMFRFKIQKFFLKYPRIVDLDQSAKYFFRKRYSRTVVTPLAETDSGYRMVVSFHLS